MSLSKINLHVFQKVLEYPGSGGNRPDKTEKMFTGTLSKNETKQSIISLTILTCVCVCLYVFFNNISVIVIFTF